MKAVHLSVSFASQSSNSLSFSQVIEQERGLVGLVEADRYPASGTLRIAALLPSRHYRLRGAAQGFCRSTADGSVRIGLTLSGPTLLAITPLI